MSVFLSYANEDESVALLLSYILQDRGIDCLVDQKLRGGEKLDSSIQSMIRKCDVFLILLTESAVNSPWVNQEIGFAAGCGKAIWPLAVQRDITPAGMLQATSSYSLFNWSSAAETIDRLVDALNRAFEKASFSDFPGALGLDHIIHGRLERRHFYLARLNDLLSIATQPLEIYLQAAFSHFAASETGAFNGQPKNEIDIAMQQKDVLIKLCRQSRTQLKLMIWPMRKYSKKDLEIRYRNLLDWMESTLDKPNIEFLCAEYEGPNRFIVKDQFCIEGYKKHPTTGYDFTLVKYGKTAIDASIREFMMMYEKARNEGHTKQTAIETIRKLQLNLDESNTG